MKSTYKPVTFVCSCGKETTEYVWSNEKPSFKCACGKKLKEVKKKTELLTGIRTPTRNR